jgi:uncharacterized protein
MISHCADCGHYTHPPSPICPRCESWNVAPQPVSGRGRVFSFTVNWQRWTPQFPPPYVIAVVELEEQDGLRITTNIEGCAHDQVAIDMPVQVAFDQGEHTWIPIFEPR